MDINSFIKKFSEIFDETDASDISPATQFRSLEEWSSLSILGLLALADEEYGVELEASDIRDSDTIEDLFEVITSKS